MNGDLLRPTLGDARRRELVRLPDGRTARLAGLPVRAGHVDWQRKARVILPGDTWLSVPAWTLELLSGPNAEADADTWADADTDWRMEHDIGVDW